LAGLFVRILLVVHFVFINGAVQANDYGVVGPIYPIEEMSLLDWIQYQLGIMKQNGDIEEMQQTFKEKVMAGIHRPHPVKGLSKTTKERFYQIDLSFTASQDIVGEDGKSVINKGETINPFDHHSLSKPIIIIDADDVEQVDWVSQRNDEFLLVLINGSPSELKEKLKKEVYFDQLGILSKRFELRQVPAVISQKGKFLQIREIKI